MLPDVVLFLLDLLKHFWIIVCTRLTYLGTIEIKTRSSRQVFPLIRSSPISMPNYRNKVYILISFGNNPCDLIIITTSYNIICALFKNNMYAPDKWLMLVPLAVGRIPPVARRTYIKQDNSSPSQIALLPDHSPVISCFVIQLEYGRYLPDVLDKQHNIRNDNVLQCRFRDLIYIKIIFFPKIQI